MARTHAVLGRFVLPLLAPLALAGCLKAHDDVVVKADGAGTYHETLVMDTAAMRDFRGAMKDLGFARPGGSGRGAPGMGEPGMDEPGMSGGDPAAAPPPAEDPLGRLKNRWKDIPGLEVTKATSEEKDGRVTVDVEATFSTLEAYARASGIEMGAELVLNSDGTYTLTFERRINPAMRAYAENGGMPKRPAGTPPEGGEAGMDATAPGGMEGGDGEKGSDGPSPAIAAALEKSLAGLEVVRTLKLPGAVLETNGTKSEDGTSVTWKATVADLKDPRAGTYFVKFKGDGLDLKAFKVERGGRGMGGGRRPPPGAGGEGK
jgi:hypothetical protein